MQSQNRGPTLETKMGKTKITTRQNIAQRTNGQTNEQLFPQKVASQLAKSNIISSRHIEIENSTETDTEIMHTENQIRSIVLGLSVL